MDFSDQFAGTTRNNQINQTFKFQQITNFIPGFNLSWVKIDNGEINEENIEDVSKNEIDIFSNIGKSLIHNQNDSEEIHMYHVVNSHCPFSRKMSLT